LTRRYIIVPKVGQMAFARAGDLEIGDPAPGALGCRHLKSDGAILRSKLAAAKRFRKLLLAALLAKSEGFGVDIVLIIVGRGPPFSSCLLIIISKL
jgi:hypothetical protein